MLRTFLLLFLMLMPTLSFAAPSEWRGVWFTRFEWTDGGAADITQRISGAMRDFAAGNFNAVIFQVRGQGDTLYPSLDEPWSPRLSADARRIDPTMHALREARRNGLQFHAWFNLSTIWRSKTKELPKDRSHPFYKFADARRPETRVGLIHDAQGRPIQWGADDYVWLTPGHPDVNAYLRRQVMNFLDRYNVDGLHWDDRTGNPHTPSRDPISVQRFQGRGNPMGMRDFTDWQHDQLTRLLSDIYVQAKAKNPRLLISAAPFGIADKHRISGYKGFKDVNDFGTEPELWMQMGVLDALMPQIYWHISDPHPNYDTLVDDWRRHNRSGRPIWPGSALGDYGGKQPLYPIQKRYVDLTRRLGMGGNTFFSWSAARSAEWRSASKSIYPTKARVPVPDHMRRQTTGQVMGWITGADGNPVTDAWIKIGNREYVYLTSGDGFFGIPNVKPGGHGLKITDGKNTISAHVKVEVGKTAQLRLRL